MNSSTSSSEPARGDYLPWFAAACLLFTAAVGLFNFGVDPLQFYRSAGYPPVFSSNQRYQNPGLARHYPYETVIVGTSHAENFLPGDVEAILGERAIKLAISGSTAREQRMILEQALATGRVRRVIWILNFLSFRKPVDALSDREGPFPHHLYAEGLDTVGLYLLSLDTLSLSLDALLGRGRSSLELLNTWHRESSFDEARVIADWHRRGRIIDRINRDPTVTPGPRVRETRASIRANLLKPLRAHPEVRFDLVFPPYSVLLYLADLRSFEGAFAERQAYKAFVVDNVASLSHVNVHDFQGWSAMTHDFDRYKDLEHFDIAANREILEAIRTGSARVDAAADAAADAADYATVLAEQRREVERYRDSVCQGDSARRGLCPRIAGSSGR